MLWVIDPEFSHPTPGQVYAFNMTACDMKEYDRSFLYSRLWGVTDEVRKVAIDRYLVWKQAKGEGFTDEIARRKRIKEEDLHKREREEIIELLLSGKFDLADQVFTANCAAWWSFSDFQETKNSAIHAIEKRRERETAQLRIDDLLRHRFFEAEQTYRKEIDPKVLSDDEFFNIRDRFVQGWLSARTPFKPDINQSCAIGSTSVDTLVVARAGSGKTSTLAGRAFFLMQHCGVKPSEILMLAFNSRAATEMEERLAALLNGAAPPHVMTFHALAHAIVHPEENLIYDSSDGKDLTLSRFVQNIIDDHIRNPEFYWRIRRLMTDHFREDWDNIESGGYGLPMEEMLKYRRSLLRETLNGDYVKSYGEKVIANFLFENRIGYLYERAEKGRLKNYKPDFKIVRPDGTGVVIEYFGMAGDPAYDAMTEEKRRYWAEKRGWTLIECYPADVAGNALGGFLKQLKNELEKDGFRCEPMSDEELWHQIRQRSVDGFTAALKGFIARCRKLELQPDALSLLIRRYKPTCRVEAQFLSLAQELYCEYVSRLAFTDQEDFDGLLNRATKAIESGITTFSRFKRKQSGDLRELRFIMIDEYQDFSKLFNSLVMAIREQNPRAGLFCVGDDWQAINGFAGSDLRYYHGFTERFKEALKLEVPTNYRSKSSIVAVGNALMGGLGAPASAFAKEPGNVLLANIGNFVPSPSEDSRHGDDKITPMALRIASMALANGQNVVFLSRTNNIQGYVNHAASQEDTDGKDTKGIEGFEKLLRSFFPEEKRHKIRVSTAHRFKGLQGDVVVVLDAFSGSYPLIHPDWVFLRALGENLEEIIAESRRLFYVALTRAAETLIVFTDQDIRSPFLDDIEGGVRLTPIRWEEWPAVVAKSTRFSVMIGNQSGRGSSPTMAIKDILKQEGYAYRNVFGWPCWMKSIPADGFAPEMLTDAKWFASANGVEIRIFDQQDRLIGRLLVDAGKVREGQVTFPNV